MSENGNIFYHYIGVTVTNIGNHDVVIQNWGFDLYDGTKMARSGCGLSAKNC